MVKLPYTSFSLLQHMQSLKLNNSKTLSVKKSSINMSLVSYSSLRKKYPQTNTELDREPTLDDVNKILIDITRAMSGRGGSRSEHQIQNAENQFYISALQHNIMFILMKLEVPSPSLQASPGWDTCQPLQPHQQACMKVLLDPTWVYQCPRSFLLQLFNHSISELCF